MGILGTFLKGRIDKMRSKTITQCHPDLRKHGESCAKMLGNFSIEVENTLIKYGSKIIGNQLPQKRIADMAINLMVSLAIVSRTTYILNAEHADEEMKKYVKDLANIALRNRRHGFMAAYREAGSNLDREIVRVTKKIEDYEGYGFDITDH